MKKLSKEQILLLHTQLIKETGGRSWSLCLEYQLIYMRNSKSNWFAVFYVVIQSSQEGTARKSVVCRQSKYIRFSLCRLF